MHGTMRAACVAALAGALVALSVAPAATAPRPPAGTATADATTKATTKAATTDRITTSTSGEQADGDAFGPRISADGRFAVFTADAANLVPGDTNHFSDVFVRDLRKGTVDRVSVGSDGVQGDGDSSAQAISADGRYVLFRSHARNLTHWDTPPPDGAGDDIYLHDRRTGSTKRMSVALDGGTAYAANATMSADARFIAFNAKADRMETDPPDLFGAVYVLDRRTGAVERVTNRARPDNPALLQGLSADGRYVAYTQLVPRSSCGRTLVHDRRTGTEEQVNVKPDGTPAARYAMPASLSADGRTIAFDYWGDEELVPGETPSSASTVYVRDLRKDVTRRVKAGPAGEDRVREPEISPDGRYVAYHADPRLTEGRLGPANVYLRDLRTGGTRLVSESVNGGPVTDLAVSVSSVGADARYAGLSSESAQLVRDDTNSHFDGFVRRLR
ncbi:TolB family protein [Streptomyces kanamyceticus]|uniref:TolB family protein n=1 Tax=Streptomyces kanamyceticus TaxID=1967 RepID=UPI0012FEAD82|nr:PD40 domain-containing protein [Streptomyces kanamyceticus]